MNELCTKCGSLTSVDWQFCAKCGNPAAAGTAPKSAGTYRSTPQPGNRPPPSKAGHTDGLAIAALAIGVASFLIPFIGSVAAVLLARAADRSIAQQGGSASGSRLATAGRITGITSAALYGALMLGVATLSFLGDGPAERIENPQAFCDAIEHGRHDEGGGFHLGIPRLRAAMKAGSPALRPHFEVLIEREGIFRDERRAAYNHAEASIWVAYVEHCVSQGYR